jgi:hypothetical protein
MARGIDQRAQRIPVRDDQTWRRLNSAGDRPKPIGRNPATVSFNDQPAVVHPAAIVVVAEDVADRPASMAVVDVVAAALDFDFGFARLRRGFSLVQLLQRAVVTLRSPVASPAATAIELVR